jgi:hypothetical protein
MREKIICRCRAQTIKKFYRLSLVFVTSLFIGGCGLSLNDLDPFSSDSPPKPSYKNSTYRKNLSNRNSSAVSKVRSENSSRLIRYSDKKSEEASFEDEQDLAKSTPKKDYDLSPTEQPRLEGFLSSWKLMSAEEKQQFIAGYLFAWRDAQEVLEIARGFIGSDPSQATASIDSMLAIYNFSSVNPVLLAHEIENFYSTPENKSAPLSYAVTTVKNKANQ